LVTIGSQIHGRSSIGQRARDAKFEPLINRWTAQTLSSSRDSTNATGRGGASSSPRHQVRPTAPCLSPTMTGNLVHANDLAGELRPLAFFSNARRHTVRCGAPRATPATRYAVGHAHLPQYVLSLPLVNRRTQPGPTPDIPFSGGAPITVSRRHQPCAHSLRQHAQPPMPNRSSPAMTAATTQRSPCGTQSTQTLTITRYAIR
jgi:hypothetical protein